MHYRRRAAPDPDLVLLHGWAMHGGVFAPLAERLRAALHACTWSTCPATAAARTARCRWRSTRSPTTCAARCRARRGWAGRSAAWSRCRSRARSPSACAALAMLVRAAALRARPTTGRRAWSRRCSHGSRSGLARDYRATLDRFLVLEAQGSDHVRRASCALLRAQVFAHGEPRAGGARARAWRCCATADLRAALPTLAMPSLWIAGRRDRLVLAAGAASRRRRLRRTARYRAHRRRRPRAVPQPRRRSRRRARRASPQRSPDGCARMSRARRRVRPPPAAAQLRPRRRRLRRGRGAAARSRVAPARAARRARRARARARARPRQRPGPRQRRDEGALAEERGGRARRRAADAAARCRKHTRLWRPVRRVCAEAAQLPFADGSFDLVFSNLCLQWVPDLPAVLAEFRRVLRPDGLLLFSTLRARTRCSNCARPTCTPARRSRRCRRSRRSSRSATRCSRPASAIRCSSARTSRCTYRDVMDADARAARDRRRRRPQRPPARARRQGAAGAHDRRLRGAAHATAACPAPGK